MTETRHLARSQAPRAARVAPRLSTAGQVTPPRAADAHYDSVLMDWCRLRTIVDALLHRVAASTDGGTAAIAVMHSTSENQERIDG